MEIQSRAIAALNDVVVSERRKRVVSAFAGSLIALVLGACGGASAPPPPAPPPAVPVVPPITYSVGGTVSGLTGTVVLQNNGGAGLSTTANGSFTVATTIPSGVGYNVTVLAQPLNQTCTVTAGAGTVTNANITSIVVTCAATSSGFTIGGTISGLGVGKSVVLRAEGDGVNGNLTVTSNGPFTMPPLYANQAEYLLLVFTQPVDQACSVTNGNNDIPGANVTNIVVTCLSEAVGAKDWGTAAPLTSRTQVEFLPKIAVAPNGDAMAVWESIRVTGFAHDIYFSRYTVGSGWSTPDIIPRVAIIDPLGDNSRNPDVAIDVNGNAIAVWKGPAAGQGFDVWSSRHTVGSGWSQRERIHINHPDFFDGSSAAKIEIDANGNALVVWNGAYGVQYNRYTVGVGWGSPTVHRVLNVPGNSIDSEPELSINANGDAMTVWQEHPGLMGESRLWSSRYNVATDTWGAPQMADPNPSHSAFANNVVIDASGNATAVWTRYDGTRLHVMANRHVAGVWGTAAAIETNNSAPFGNAHDSRTAIDGSGNVLTLWRQVIDDDTGYYMSRRFTPAGGWAAPVVIGNYVGVGNQFEETDYDLASNAAGNAVAVWTLSRGEESEGVFFGPDLWSNQYVVGSGWSLPEVIDGEDAYDGNYAVTPSVGIDASGNALAVWEGMSSDTQLGDILFNRME